MLALSKNTQKCLGLEALFVLLWNSGFITAELGLPYSGPWTLLFWRHMALSFVLGLWLLLSKRFIWPGYKAFTWISFIGILAHGVWLSCVLIALDSNVPAGIVALITSLQPLLTGALAGPFLKERTTPRQWNGLFLGFLGVSVVVATRLSNSQAHFSFINSLLPLGSALSLTLASLLQRKWSKNRSKDKNNLSLDNSLFYQVTATSVFLLPYAYWMEGFEASWPPVFIGTMVWLVLGVSFGAYYLMWKLLEMEEATRVASLFYLSPPVTLVLAWIIFNDSIKITDLLGLLIGGLGVYLVYKPKKKFKAPNK